MNHAANSPAKARLDGIHKQLVDWLVNAAYPHWAQHGVDQLNGGFIEVLSQDGTGLPHARRARVHPRQVYAFAKAPQFGWSGDARGIVSRGLSYFVTHYKRPDGLYRTLADVHGKALDERAVLYDQAFALLGLASAAKFLGTVAQLEPQALALRDAIQHRLAAPGGGFRSLDSGEGHRESNPHMHLLEACLAWTELGTDSGWKQWVKTLVELAKTRFIRADSGALAEVFTPEWQPGGGVHGRIIEPGHQFEWAWLLLTSEMHGVPNVRGAALRLIEIGENYGVRNGVAINALLDDFTVHDDDARFWPQTERLKAALLAAEMTGEDRYWAMAEVAAKSFLPYIDTPVKGLWLDIRKPDGEILDAPSPASSFYHIVCSIAELDTAVRSAK